MFLTKSWILLAIVTGKVMGKDCYNKKTKGTDYSGPTAVAASGNPCTSWQEGLIAEVYDTDKTFDEWIELRYAEFQEKYGVSRDSSVCLNPLPDKFEEPWCYTEAEYDGETYTTIAIKRETCGIEICPDEDDTKDETDGEKNEEYSSASPQRPLFLLVALTLIAFINF